MVGEGIEDLGGGEDVEANKEDVVGEEHEAAELVGEPVLAKDVVSEVADVFYLRVAHDVFVHCDRGEPEEETGEYHGDDSWNPS